MVAAMQRTVRKQGRGDQNLRAKVTLEIEVLEITHLVEGEMELG
jgi:hypothetical protein